jgi:hypothetical protein
VAIEWEMDHGNLSIFVNGKEMLANNGRIGSKLYFPTSFLQHELWKKFRNPHGLTGIGGRKSSRGKKN